MSTQFVVTFTADAVVTKAQPQEPDPEDVPVEDVEDDAPEEQK